MSDATRVSEESIQKHSKSFALASRVLPEGPRRHAVALYAWCRRADDAVDLAASDEQPAALAALSAELKDIYADNPQTDPILSRFQETVRDRAVPMRYAEDLLVGMDMDVQGRRYDTTDDLLEYCYYVAGCVGLMMCHVMGVSDERALKNAAHLGIAMQITNICRDVREDWGRDRLYLPDDLLTECGAPGLAERLGDTFPRTARHPVAEAIARLLDLAEDFYQSGDAGLYALSGRCSMAIRTARRVYSSIGERLRRVGCDPLAGRAYVPFSRKLVLMGSSIAASTLEIPSRLARGSEAAVSVPSRILKFPEDILPIEARP